MTGKPTGVFVRLPLSDTEKMALTSGVKMGGDIEAGIAAIGTPVTGGELEVFGIVDAAYGDSDAKYVCQSDALAKLADKDAEIARLNSENEHQRTQLLELRNSERRNRLAIETARGDISLGNPMKAAYALEAALKGPGA